LAPHRRRRLRSVAFAVAMALAVSACVGRPSDDATGEEIYLQLCSNCHGDHLQGGLGPSLGAGSDAASQPDEFLRVTITEGRGRMPSFSSSLSDDQIDLVIDFLRSEQAG
jgi:mono/diheme cytochrome c family protein